MSKIQLRSEQLVINAILTAPSEIHSIMASVSVDMFEFPVNKLIFQSISDLYMQNEPINLISLYKKIKEIKSIHKNEALSSTTTIHSMFTNVDRLELPTAISTLVSENIRHEHIELGKTLQDVSQSDDYEPSKVINIIQNHIVDNKFKSLLNKKEMSNKDLLDQLDKKMLEAAQHKGISGIRTGYDRFDLITSGMQPTNFIVVAGRPAMGKTQFALGIMDHASVRGQKKGLFISCEMDEVQVMKRIIAVDSGVHGYSIKRGTLERHEVLKFEKARNRIIDSSSPSLCLAIIA